MNPIINQNSFFIKEHVGIFKAANNFDIYNPASNQIVLHCREEKLGFFTKMLRFTQYKKMTPFEIEIKTVDGEKICTVSRNIAWFLSKVSVLDENNLVVGYFKQKFFSIGGKFDIVDTNNQILCTLKGKWTSWDFKFEKDGQEFAAVNKKWAGFGKEMFTSADNYGLTIDPKVPENNKIRLLILASVMCIDMVLKE